MKLDTDSSASNSLASGAHPRAVRRVAWLAGTRGEILLLGPAFQALSRRRVPDLHHWMTHTGENGMAACQALDYLRLIPDEQAPLCHPADEPAVRLKLMIERAEAFVRRRKGTHAVFSGFGPTAAGGAIYCHARGCQGLWLRPPDPAGLIPRLRWEAGLERIMRACAPCVEVWQVPAAPDWLSLGGRDDAELGIGNSNSAFAIPHSTLEEIPGLRADADLVMIAVLRREWGSPNDTTSLLARAVAAWAGAWPAADWLVLSNLNARLEGPLRSLKAPPANLLLAPPLPYPLYREALGRARLIVTDSPLIAAEAMQLGVPVASLGDSPPEKTMKENRNYPITPEDLLSEEWFKHLASVMKESMPVQSRESARTPEESILEVIHRAIATWLGI